jgi:hypothetical protein
MYRDKVQRVIVSHVQHCLIFAGKAQSLPFEWSSSWVASSRTCNFWTKVERHARDKHSSLFGFFISDEEKSFLGLTSSANCWHTMLFNVKL